MSNDFFVSGKQLHSEPSAFATVDGIAVTKRRHVRGKILHFHLYSQKREIKLSGEKLF